MAFFLPLSLPFLKTCLWQHLNFLHLVMISFVIQLILLAIRQMVIDQPNYANLLGISRSFSLFTTVTIPFLLTGFLVYYALLSVITYKTEVFYNSFLLLPPFFSTITNLCFSLHAYALHLKIVDFPSAASLYGKH